MPLTTTSGSGTWNGHAMAVTSVIVWPPGFDCDTTRIAVLTYRKATGFTIAINQLVCIAHDATGEIATASVAAASYFVRATTAAASGATSFQGQKVPSFTSGAWHFTDAQRNDMGATGDPQIRAASSFSNDLDYAPSNNASVYAYIDGGGVTRTTSNAATAATGVSYWIVGTTRTTAHAGPAGVDIMRYPVNDSGLSAGTYLALSDRTLSIQAAGTPPALSGVVFSNSDSSLISSVGSASTPISIGQLIGVETRTTPSTYYIQSGPYSDHGFDATYAPLKSAQQTIIPINGDPVSTYLSTVLVQIGIYYDDFVLVTSGANEDRVPSTSLQIFAPLISNAPDFAVDCTLPSPFGPVRVIWAGGTVQLSKRSDATTPPRATMVRSNWNPLASKVFNIDKFDGVDPGTPTGLIRAENGACPYPLRGWNGPHASYDGVLPTYSDYSPPHRLGIYPASVRLVVHTYLNPGYSSCRFEYGWAIRNANSRIRADPIGSLTNISTPTFTDTGTFNHVFYDVTIAPPSGSADDVASYVVLGSFYATYSGVESLIDFAFAYPLGISTQLCNKFLAFDPNNLFDPPVTALIDGGTLLPVSGDPYPLEVWPEDIQQWRPAPDDVDCAYVGHNGWKWPNPTPMPTVTRNYSAAASWSAGVLTITAMPTMTWTGNSKVDGPSTTPTDNGNVGYALRVTCPELGVTLYLTPLGVTASATASYYNNSFFNWAKSETSAPIGFAFYTNTIPPITVNCPKPIVSGSCTVIIELWEVRLVGTTYGGDAQLANFQRLTVTIP